MSSPPLLLLLFAVASAGPLDTPTLMPSSSTTATHEEQAVPAATIAPSTDGQHCSVGGVAFHNGARLPDPDPCRACYCQAGEPVCSRVHCYRRPDCAPKHVPGSCCPKYDNCPPVQDERSPSPRLKDAATQTDPAVEQTTTLMTTTEVSTDTPATTSVTEPTTTAATTPEVAASEEPELVDEESTAEAAGVTNAYPPGIDLYPLHEHLPFLSPGDANGPNT